MQPISIKNRKSIDFFNCSISEFEYILDIFNHVEFTLHPPAEFIVIVNITFRNKLLTCYITDSHFCHLCLEFCLQIGKNYLSVINLMSSDELLAWRSSFDYSVLRQSIYFNRPDAVSALLFKHGCPSYKGLLAMATHIDIVKILLQFGYSPNDVNEFSEPALSLAHNEQIFDCILHAKPNKTTLNVSLCNMMIRKQWNRATKLLVAGADANFVCNSEHPLSIAARCGQFDLVKDLINRGSDVSWQDKYGNSAAHAASTSNMRHYLCSFPSFKNKKGKNACTTK